MGRSLPRAIAAAKSAGRAPPFELPTAGRKGEADMSNKNKADRSTATSKRKRRLDESGGPGIEEMIEGHPRRAVEEISMRSRLEVVRGEVEEVLKTHGSMARGERESWLKQIERQNEESSYQVFCLQ